MWLYNAEHTELINMDLVTGVQMWSVPDSGKWQITVGQIYLYRDIPSRDEAERVLAYLEQRLNRKTFP